MNSKAILITGCSSGIGRHCASALQERGYQVIATARQQEDVAQLQAQGLTALPLDLEYPESIESALEQTLALTGGQLYALFNNGAYGQPGAIEDLPTAALRAQFETNLFGWHHLTRLVIPLMRNQKQGRIVQNSSVLGLVAMPYRGAYNASKFAIEGYTDTLRLELAGSGVFPVLIEPGPIESRFRANALAAFRRYIDAANSLHRAAYEATEARLNKPGVTSRFTLGPEAVCTALIKALESPRPKARYGVTTPTLLMAGLRRCLPTPWLDRLLQKG